MKMMKELRRARRTLLSAQIFWVEDGGFHGPVSWADLTRSVQEQVRRVMNGRVLRVVCRGIILQYRSGRLVGVRPV